MNKFCFYTLLLAITLFSCKQNPPVLTLVDASETVYQVDGRFHKSDGIELISTAATVTFQMEGEELVLHLGSNEDSHNYVALVVDGEYKQKVRVEKGKNEPIQIPFSTKATRIIELVKESEARSGSVYFYGAEASSISKVENEKTLNLEFIGDSITCAAESDTSQVPCGDREVYHDQHSSYHSYASVTARNVNANARINCVSGIGLYRNWNSETDPAMPDVYQNAYLDERDIQASPAFSPDITFIALGTNDMSDGNEEFPRTNAFSVETYTKNYIAFVQQLHQWNPSSKFVLLNSPMIHGDRAITIHGALNNIQHELSKLGIESDVFLFEPEEGKGCGYHPDIAEQQHMAEQLTAYLQSKK